MRALIWIVCLAACDAGAKPEPATTPAPHKPAVPIPDRQQAADGFRLAYLPADSDVIIHVDVAKLRQSKLWATYESDARKILAPGFGGCDYDPLSQASSVDIGVQIESQLTTYVVHGMDRDRSKTCFGDQQKGNGPPTVSVDGDYVTLTTSTASRVLTFVDDHTLVMQGSKAPTKQTLQNVIAAGTPLGQNRELAAALVRAKTSSAITAVSRPGSKAMTDSMSKSGAKVSWFFGSIDLDARLALHYAMDLDTPDGATQMATMMKAQMSSPAVKQMFDRFDVQSQDKTVTMDLVLGETKLATLAGMLRGMIPGD